MNDQFQVLEDVGPSLTLFFEPLAVQPYKARVSMSQKRDSCLTLSLYRLQYVTQSGSSWLTAKCPINLPECYTNVRVL